MPAPWRTCQTSMVTARAMITAADAFFVASYADREDRRQVDVSHRGGKAGFVRVADDGTLTIPDFDGNLFFSTLGNIVLNGKAGLVFVDYASGDMLQMTGDAEVILDSPEIAAFQGAERLWTFKARRIVRRRNALALRWAFREDGWSANSLMTGDWAQAADRLRAAALATRWRVLTVTQDRRGKRLDTIVSSAAGRWRRVAAAYCRTASADPPDCSGRRKACHPNLHTVGRPSDGVYRISVKRDGAVSQHLHDQHPRRRHIEARAPAGGFHHRRPRYPSGRAACRRRRDHAPARHVAPRCLRGAAQAAHPAGHPLPCGAFQAGASVRPGNYRTRQRGARRGQAHPGLERCQVVPKKASTTTPSGASTWRCFLATCRSTIMISISAGRRSSPSHSMTGCVAIILLMAAFTRRLSARHP